jgi:hypothetical protein
MTPTDPNVPIIRRFNGYSSASSIPTRSTWPLRTEKLIGDTWTTIARWPMIRGVGVVRRENEQRQRAGLAAHVDAFGGLVRLMRGDLLLATWVDGEVVADFRTESAT